MGKQLLPDNPLVSATPLRGRSGIRPDLFNERPFLVPVLVVAFLSYLLAMPILVVLISIDIDFGGRWMCDPRPVGVLGTVYDRDGVPICQFEIIGVLLVWSLFAAVVSLVPMFGVYLFRHLRRIRQLRSTTGRMAKVRLWRAFFLNIGLCVLFAAAVGRGWVLSLLILPGVALAMYSYRYWRALQQDDDSW